MYMYQDITSDLSSIPWLVPIEICTWLDWLDSTRLEPQNETKWLNLTQNLTRSLQEPGGPCTKSMEVSESCMEWVKWQPWIDKDKYIHER